MLTCVFRAYQLIGKSLSKTMIRREIYVERFKWRIHAFFAVTDYWVEPIMDLLWHLGCDAETAKRAYENITSGDLDTGLCYSNYAKKESVMVIAKTSSADEFFNSFLHEMSHLQGHVCNVLFLSPDGEDIAYFTGNVAMELYPSIKHLLCDTCRNKHLGHEKEGYT